jgi:shikimate 5-dehydrogenase
MTPLEPSADEQLSKDLVERARSEGAQLVVRGFKMLVWCAAATVALV